MKLTLKLAALAVAGSIAVAGTVSAAPLLQIQLGPNASPEETGDNGGTGYPWAGGGGPGAGAPSVLGGWSPNGPGMRPDPSFNNSLGTGGWHNGYLYLTEAATVRFEFMGAGDSGDMNRFLLNNQLMFMDSNGGLTYPCPIFSPSTVPACDKVTGGPDGQNQYDIALQAGLIPFSFITGGTPPVTLINDGQNNPNPDDPQNPSPGYLLGIDPYLPEAAPDVNGDPAKSGRAAYAALTDEPGLGDHDYQDMVVRISIVSVPEPASLALLGIALGGLGFSRRRRADA